MAPGGRFTNGSTRGRNHMNLPRQKKFGLAHAIVWVGLLLAAPAFAGELSTSEARGKQIYLYGTSPSGAEITAHVGANAVTVPAGATPCGNCHGADGTGRPESGVIPSDIRWSRLTKPYGAVAAGGRRRHPAYDEEALKRAVLGGVDPADNPLDSAMPRFQMSTADLDDLVAYLKRLESDLDAGLGEDAIVLGTVLPQPRGPESIGRVMTTVLQAYFDDLNGRGGVHGRRLELAVEHADSPDDALAQARRLVEKHRVFALVGAFTAGADGEFAELAETHTVPLVGPFTQSGPLDIGTRQFTFYLLSGAEIQGRALVEFAISRLPDPSIGAALVHPARPDTQAVARAMAKQSEDRGWGSLRVVAYPAGDMDPGALAGELKDSGVQIVFFLGSGAEFRMLATTADRIGWRPFMFLQGHLAGRAAVTAPASFQGHIYVAFPTSPQDQSPEGRREFGEFARRHGLPRRHLAAQITTYTAAKLLVEGLSQAGRDLSREKLLQALEGLYGYTTGLTPPLTYGPNRRVGALGAHIVAVDVENRRFASGSTWVQPD